MPKSTLAGHPLHPQLITAPLGLLPFSLAMDAMHLATGNETYAEAAHLAMKAGVAGGLAAGASGAVDYFAIPERSDTKRHANVHGAMNLAVMGLYGVNLALRSRRRRRWRSPSGRIPTLLSVVGAVGLFGSAWIGGHMVYEHGMRVKGRSEIEDAPDWAPPGDDVAERALAQAAARAARRAT